MKKVLSIILTISMIVILTGCGANQAAEGGNEITRLFDEGYQCVIATASESSWNGIFQKADSFDTLYLVKANMTAKEYRAFDAISYDDEDAESRKQALLGTLSDVTVTDISDKIPSQEELEGYIGKTLGELEDEGFENCGYMGDEGNYQFFYEGPVYSCTVSLEEGTVIEDMDDYSLNDLRALKIGGMEFTGISSQILDAE